jgi:hypothetical protein
MVPPLYIDLWLIMSPPSAVNYNSRGEGIFFFPAGDYNALKAALRSGNDRALGSSQKPEHPKSKKGV